MRTLAMIAGAIGLVAVSARPVAQSADAQHTAPKLVVLLVVDQMRADYLTTFAHRWRAGFRELLDHGAQFVNAEYPYYSTITCAGHSTISTGTLPRTHGMVLNRWWERSEHRIVACTDDAAAPQISYGRPVTSGHSGKRLLASTLPDELRAQKPGARVISLSLKPRSAIGMAGHGGDAVVWFDDPSSSFVTSTAFAPKAVPAVAAFVSRDDFVREETMTWRLSEAADTYRFQDVVGDERPDFGWTALFPHVLAGAAPHDRAFGDHWQKSPLSDAYLDRMAEALIDEWHIGQRDTTDFLGIGFSALDMAGHDFGPRSREVEDILLRLDGTIGRLIAHLDRTVGRNRYVLALTADHGVAVIPEQVGAGRIANEDIKQVVEQALVAQWGEGQTSPYVDAAIGSQVYLSPAALTRLRSSPPARAGVERALLDVKGIERVVWADRLDGHDSATTAITRGYVSDRSGDLFVVPQRDWIVMLRSDNDATTHGTMYDYDRRVPLLLFGAGIAPGRYSQTVGPVDVAPTLAHLAGVTFANRDGRPLREAIR